jgi:hypothetical protein
MSPAGIVHIVYGCHVSKPPPLRIPFRFLVLTRKLLTRTSPVAGFLFYSAVRPVNGACCTLTPALAASSLPPIPIRLNPEFSSVQWR